MAVDSFLAFKKLMVKRNQELNRQAMEMFSKIQGQPGETPTATGAPKAGENNTSASTLVTDASAAASDKSKPLTEEEKK